ncbi:MAG: hypothetical protein LBC96_07840 [Lachnospiraceae bacterium]|nr:hypothetical protein [Lachnospiraceae bacterium]
MTNSDFLNESIDYKKMFLCMRQKLLWLIIAAVAGALLCGTLYLVIREATGETLYRSRSQFYVQFIYDPSGQVVQQYNGFTWNDLIHSDLVMDYIVAALKETGNQGQFFASDEVMNEELRDNCIRGDIYSDLRLLTVTVASASREMSAFIQDGMERGLLEFAAAQAEIASMEIITSAAPQLVVWDNHLHRAIIAGAVFSFILSFFIWWLYYILDDSLYTTADINQRYPHEALGILLAGETLDTLTPYFAEVKENIAFHTKEKANVRYLAVDELPYPDGEELRQSDGVIVTIPYGKRNGKVVERCLGYLHTQQVAVIGLLIVEADVKFLRSYYRSKCK